ncbi:TPA: phage minor tail protein L, partial [Acinetobacter baumannii]
DPNLDACGKRVSSCTCRFGENAVLPYGAFPGVQRV